LSTGSVIATIIWIAASVGFSFYVANFGSYGKTYGALAGVVVLLIWFWITALAVLIGAEINAEAEAQTVKDTTKGDPKPLGTRGAVKADQRPPRNDNHEGVNMKGKLVLIISVVAAYVMGARAGRERYEQIMASVKQALNDPRVQEAAAQAGEAVKDKTQSVRPGSKAKASGA
jgi:Virulence factor BrkB